MKVDDLQDKVAVVTGAGGGMGGHIAGKLAEQGAKLFLCDINRAHVAAAEAKLKHQGAQALSEAVDISSEREVELVFRRIEEQWGTVDILVNCAAIWDECDFEAIDEARWTRVIDINLKGIFLVCREAMSLMRKNRGGSIVNFASTAGEYGSIRPAAHYAASKGGVIALSKSLAREGAAHRIRVNVVSPGPTDTPMLNVQNDQQRILFGERTLLGRIGTPDDMANAVLFLASSAAGWITGDVLRVNGGSLL